MTDVPCGVENSVHLQITMRRCFVPVMCLNQYESFGNFLHRPTNPIHMLQWVKGPCRTSFFPSRQPVDDVLLSKSMCHSVTSTTYTLIDLNDYSMASSPLASKCRRFLHDLNGTPTLTSMVCSSQDAQLVPHHPRLYPEKIPSSTFTVRLYETQVLCLGTDTVARRLDLSCGVHSAFVLPETCISADLDDDVTIFGGINGCVYATDVNATCLIHHGTEAITAIKVVPNPHAKFRYIVIGRENGKVDVLRWCFTSMRCTTVWSSQRHASSVRDIAVHASRIVTADSDGYIGIGMLHSDSDWLSIRIGSVPVRLSASSHHIAAATWDGVYILDFSTDGRPRHATTRIRPKPSHPPLLFATMDA